MTTKSDVRDFWDAAACGEVYADGPTLAEQLDAQARIRYQLEPYLAPFARFAEGRGKDVLEIGVGMGADHLEWARSQPRSLTGVDLTPRAIELTRQRLGFAGLASDLRVADAEQLPFADASFDLVYSWGVLHHSPDTPRAIGEVHRVLRPGGVARVMIYHKWSIVGLLLWTRYALLAGRPFTSLDDVYATHLESPGTKAYTVDETRTMFARFSSVDARSILSFGDLLEGEVGQRHRGRALAIAKKYWPRRALRRFAPRQGLALLVDARA
jgi:ubiquinone/menaquinone biosynthesis C-methylase UbiE